MTLHQHAPDSPSGRSKSGVLRRTGVFSARHALPVIIGWLVALAVLQALHASFGGTYSDDFSLPGTQSYQGAQVLQQNAPGFGGTGTTVVLKDVRRRTAWRTASRSPRG